MFLHLLRSFGNFFSCSIWVGIYQMWNLQNECHKPYMKKLNQAFAITVKRVVYLTNFLGHKSATSYVATFTSALSATKCTFFPNKCLHFSCYQMVSQTVTKRKWNKWRRCKNSLNFLFGIQECKIFSYNGTKVVKTGAICRNKQYTFSFLSGLPNRSSQLFVETLLIWAFTNFCWYPLLQKQVFTFSRCFWKVNVNKVLCIYIYI